MARETRKLMIRAAVLVLAVILTAGVLPAQAEETDEQSVLPLDFSGGMALNKDYFMGNWKYEDPTISVSVTQGTASFDSGNCAYWVADIKIAHASQLRTMAANSFEYASDGVDGRTISKRVNAVLAISGDSYAYTGHGLIVRQGKVFLNALQGDRDVLVIDADGDFHVVTMANRGDIGPTIKGKKVINTFFFGPALVLDGKVVWNMTQLTLKDDMKANEGRQRICIAQVGPLEYKCICCAGPYRDNTGMTIPQFTQLVASMGVQTAYNLDGGNTTKMYFNNELINNVNKEDRGITDIIYFASALGMDSSAASQYTTAAGDTAVGYAAGSEGSGSNSGNDGGGSNGSGNHGGSRNNGGGAIVITIDP